MLHLTEEDVSWLREVSAEGATAGSEAGRLFAELERFVDSCTARTLDLDSDGNTGWWHSAPRRIKDVAAAHRIKPHGPRAAWLHRTVLDICKLPTDAWIGPFFRKRVDPPVGTLESAGVAMAVAEAASIAPEVFTSSEHDQLREVVHDRGVTLSRRFLDNAGSMSGPPDPESAPATINNWAMTILNGYGTAAVFTNDTAAIDETIRHYDYLASLFETDSYGESLAYWAMAASQMANLYDTLVGYRPELFEVLDLDCYTRCIPWAVHSHLGTAELPGLGSARLPQALNFGDSDATFRPSASLLVHCASRARASHPIEAGLARWLFDETYGELLSEQQDSFAMRGGVPWTVLVQLRTAADPLSPQEAGLDRVSSFAAGTAILRDRWSDTHTVLGIQGSPVPLKVDSHRHDDLNSFILVHKGERLFADPGRCSYRLHTQQLSTVTSAHNTWTFTSENETLDQADAGVSAEPLCCGITSEDVSYVVSDVGWAYPSPISVAQRTWLLVGSHLVVVCDRIISDEPVRVHTHFVLNNRDNDLHVGDRALFNPGSGLAELYLDRGGVGARFLQLDGRSDRGQVSSRPERRWGYIHDLYNPQPNQPGQGREGSAVIYDLVTVAPVERYESRYLIVLDDVDALSSWSIAETAPDSFVILGPGEATALEFEGSQIRVNGQLVARPD